MNRPSSQIANVTTMTVGNRYRELIEKMMIEVGV